MSCLLSSAVDSGEGSEKTDLNWSFSTMAYFLLLFSSFRFLFSGATPCVNSLVSKMCIFINWAGAASLH